MQIYDIFRHEGHDYLVAGMSEGDLFTPSDVGLSAVGVDTACWRGFQAILTIHDGQLLLSTLHINLQEHFGDDFSRKLPPNINGIVPRIPDRELELPGEVDPFNTHYDQLNHPLTYTGGVLLTHGFADGVHLEEMGFQEPWKYEMVIELTFNKGVFSDELNCSSQMQSIRQAQQADLTPNNSHSKQSNCTMVFNVFDRSYRLDAGT